MSWTVGQLVNDVKGFVTDEKYLKGETLGSIESRLGFHKGRLAKGATFVVLCTPPNFLEFSPKGYSQVAGHHYDEQYGKRQLDHVVLKRNVIQHWRAKKAQIIKVYPAIRHDNVMTDNEQYPPGSGVPQWEVTTGLSGRVVAILSNLSDVYRR